MLSKVEWITWIVKREKKLKKEREKKSISHPKEYISIHALSQQGSDGVKQVRNIKECVVIERACATRETNHKTPELYLSNSSPKTDH